MDSFLINQPWTQMSFVCLDLETTGAFPVGDSICEIGAVLWKKGAVQDEFQTLVKPPYPLTEENVKIHKITNKMLVKAPIISDVIEDFLKFIKGHILVAHHAPFDLGFLAYDFEKLGYFPETSQVFLCSSLLARKLIPEAPRHKLQTLVKYLKIESSVSHRALEDSHNCLKILLECLNRIGREKTIKDILEVQDKKMSWEGFFIKNISLPPSFIEAILENKRVSFEYNKKSRLIYPYGIVRNPDGDYLAGKEDFTAKHVKRFYCNKIKL